MSSLSVARERLEAMPAIRLGHLPTPIDEAPRLRDAIGMGARLLVKRDDTLPFGFGGNKVRKLMLVTAEARSQGADTLISCGGVQSNHCRATAAAAARLGMRCHLVMNGDAPDRLTGNILLDDLLGAEITYVAEREDRAPGMALVAERVRSTGGHPYVIPLGASTPLGAMGLARAVGEMVEQSIVPDVIVAATSSGGTQAGLIAGCALYGVRTRILGISADASAEDLRPLVLGIVAGIEERLGLPHGSLGAAERFEADAGFVGDGYGVPTADSREAQLMAARNEAIITDHWYTAKALAGLTAHARNGAFEDGKTVLFWHTGGQVGVFAG